MLDGEGLHDATSLFACLPSTSTSGQFLCGSHWGLWNPSIHSLVSSLVGGLLIYGGRSAVWLKHTFIVQIGALIKNFRWLIAVLKCLIHILRSALLLIKRQTMLSEIGFWQPEGVLSLASLYWLSCLGVFESESTKLVRVYLARSLWFAAIQIIRFM